MCYSRVLYVLPHSLTHFVLCIVCNRLDSSIAIVQPFCVSSLKMGTEWLLVMLEPMFLLARIVLDTKDVLMGVDVAGLLYYAAILCDFSEDWDSIVLEMLESMFLWLVGVLNG